MDLDEDEIILKPRPEEPPKEIPFWSENPNILLNVSQINELFPAGDMSYNQKLNAITRMVIILTVVVYLFTQTFRSIIFGAISVFSIYLVHYYYAAEKAKKSLTKDAFTGLGGQTANTSPAISALDRDLDGLSAVGVFDEPSAENPFSNVMLNDYDYNPNKKPAPAATKVSVNAQIFKEAKQLVSNLNPDQPDIANKLFKDLGEQFVFEQSLRPFYSTASTTIPNDQTGFADFCYGSMISCKEGNQFACARNLSRHINM
jgi:hypothetical protein